MLAVIIILFFVFIGGLFVADKICISINGELLTTRFLSCKNTFYLFLSILLNVFVVSWASYLRCHKKSLLLYSILCGLVCCMVIFLHLIFGGRRGYIGIFIYKYLVFTLCIFNICNEEKTMAWLIHQFYQFVYRLIIVQIF